MLGITGLLLVQFFFLPDVEVQSCQVTSNVSNNSNTAVVDLHERFIINCSSTQRNGSNVTFEIWPPYGMGLTGSKKYIWHFKKSILYFVDVKSSSGGKLTCKIKQNNSVEESCDFTVIVKASPQVSVGRLFAPLGKRLSLTCFIKGYYKPNKITWYKNGQQIIPHKDNYTVENEDKFQFAFYSTLKRDQLSLNDSANYSCEATNTYGTSIGYRFLTYSKVREHLPKKVCPEFANKSKEINVIIRLGSTWPLLCEVDHNRYHNPPFFCINRITNNTNKHLFCPLTTKRENGFFSKTSIGNEKTLANYTIVNASRNDSGTYVCTYVGDDPTHCPKRLHKTFNVKVVIMKDKMEKEQQNINVLMVVAVSVAGTLCGLALVIYVCHLRRKLKAAQFYDTCPDDSPELRWDVFVSYSSKDFEWVNDNLCTVLEKPPFNLRVCLHQRDWELGRSVVDNMVESVLRSQKTLIIVSENYLQSEYCMQELKIAMHREIDGDHMQRDRIVLIKIDDVSMQRLPRFLRQKSFLDCCDPEHARHFQTNLMRVLPRREVMDEGCSQDEEQRGSGGSIASSSSSEIKLQDFQNADAC